jgi:hypothetical protein
MIRYPTPLPLRVIDTREAFVAFIILLIERVLAVATGAVLLLPGCADVKAVSNTAAERSLPIAVASSADLGCIASGTGNAIRIVRLSNFSTEDVRISRWKVSCECLTVAPPSINLPPNASSFIQLGFDPDKESSDFVGNLLIEVEAFAGSELVGAFSVPVSVISAENIKHLGPWRDSVASCWYTDRESFSRKRDIRSPLFVDCQRLILRTH